MRTLTCRSLALLSLLTLTVGCESLDRMMNPTKYMTPEELVAHNARVAAETAERAKQKAAWDARNVQDLITPGEAHAEARDAAIAGHYSYDWQRDEERVPMFHKQVRKGKRHKAEHLTLFANGSFARRVDTDIWNYDGGSEGSEAQQAITRGQWKTEGNRIMVRPLLQFGLGGWADIGAYQLKGNHLMMIDDKAIEAEVKRRNLKENQGKEALLILGERTYDWAR